MKPYPDVAQLLLQELDGTNARYVMAMIRDGVMPEGALESVIKLLAPIKQGTGFMGTEDRINAKAAEAPGATNTAGLSTKAHYSFGSTSLRNLQGVLPGLVALANQALRITEQDFAITDGLRTPEEQAANVKKGVSKTLHSMHLPQAGGFAWAIDATPFVNGKLAWNWQDVYPVVVAFHQAALDLGFAEHIRWGGAWDRRLSDFGTNLSHTLTRQMIAAECEAYQKRHPGSDFIDGPHFEWVA